MNKKMIWSVVILAVLVIVGIVYFCIPKYETYEIDAYKLEYPKDWNFKEKLGNVVFYPGDFLIVDDLNAMISVVYTPVGRDKKDKIIELYKKGKNYSNEKTINFEDNDDWVLIEAESSKYYRYVKIFFNDDYSYVVFGIVKKELKDEYYKKIRHSVDSFKIKS